MIRSVVGRVCLPGTVFNGSVGGDKQFTEMIERGDMDMVIFFYNPTMINPKEPDVYKIIRTCDQYNIPIATNIGTAESPPTLPGRNLCT